MADPNRAAGPHNPIGPVGPLPTGLLPPPSSIFGGGPGRKGPSGWAQLAMLVGVVVLTTAGWSIWSLVSGSSAPAPRAPVARPRATSSPSPTPTPSPTTASPTTAHSPTPTSRTTAPSPTTTSPTTTPARSPSGVGQPVGRATQVAPTPLPVPPVGTQPARVRFDVASSAGTGRVTYGSNSDADVDLRDQRLPFAVEVTVPTDSGYVFVLGSADGSAGESTTLRCRVYVNDVLVKEQLARSSCIAGVSMATVFGS